VPQWKLGKNSPRHESLRPDFLENLSVKEGTIILATDSYLKSVGEAQDKLGNSHGCPFPIIDDVHVYFHCHYQDLNHEGLEAISLQIHPDFLVEEFVERMATCPRFLDSYLLTLGDLFLQTSSAVILSPGEVPLTSLLVHKASWSEGKANLVFHSQGSQSYINTDTPPNSDCRIMVNDDGLAVLIARIESPVDTDAIWEVKLANDPKAEWTKKVFNMKKGLNHVRIEYEGNPGDVLEWKFTPGQVAGDYVFRSIPEHTLLQKPGNSSIDGSALENYSSNVES
jgi:hypothetical protein